MTAPELACTFAAPAPWVARVEYSRLKAAGPGPLNRTDKLAWYLKVACLALAAEMPEEAREGLTELELDVQGSPESDWLSFTRETVWTAWLRLIRASAGDMPRVPGSIEKVRALQQSWEMAYFQGVGAGAARAAALELMALYFMGSAAEKLAQGHAAGGLTELGRDKVAEFLTRAVRVLMRGSDAMCLELAELLSATQAHCSPVLDTGRAAD